MSAVTGPAGLTILPLGALIHTFPIAGQNIVLSFPNAETYKSHNSPFLGETLGRVANRIPDGKIFNLNGRDYELQSKNDGERGNTLHGGEKGWGKQIWNGPKLIGGGPTNKRVAFSYRSEDGDEGFPGAVEATITYTTSASYTGKRIVLEIEYEARIAEDSNVEETLVSLTNHSYFNLSSGNTLTGHEMLLPSTKHLPIDSRRIPTGEVTNFPGVEPNRTIQITDDFPKIDHCFITSDADPSTIPIDTRNLHMKTHVQLKSPETNLNLLVESTEPACQIYTADGMDVPAISPDVKVEDGTSVDDPRMWAAKGPRAGMAIEPERYVNAASVPEWRGMVLLKKGEVYGSKFRYTAWQQAEEDDMDD